MLDQTMLEQTLKQVMNYLAQKQVVEPLVITDNVGNEERVSLAPISDRNELRAFRETMAGYLGGGFGKIIQTEVSKRTYVLNINKAGRLMDIYAVMAGVTSPTPIYKFTVKQDGDMVTVLGNEIARSHLRLQNTIVNNK